MIILTTPPPPNPKEPDRNSSPGNMKKKQKLIDGLIFLPRPRVMQNPYPGRHLK